MDGGRAFKFFEQILGIQSGELNDTVSERFFFWEMLLAFGLTESAYNRLPRHERQEMWTWFKYRNEREHQLQQRAQAEARMQNDGLR